jgi:NAD(P)-dependent dehydrogenase (short-subunit alcohol dehydrogenase family)
MTTKTAIVTGGAKGLGAAICQLAAKRGYRVGVLDLKRANCQALLPTLAGSGHVALQADVTDEHQVKAAFDEFGVTPDLLVNNAGIVRFGSLLEQTVDDFRAAVNVSLIGTYIGAREAALRMVKRGSGVIINMSSLNAVTPGPGSGGYPAAKAGVAKLTEHLSLELGPLGIRVNCVAPGFIDGGMSAPIYADPRVRQLRGGAVPLRRLGLVEDVANAVMWLASDESAYITGHQLVVDGGVAHSVLLQLPRKVD